ncbi:MAG: hypothetical protein JNL04_05815 [Rhodospirillaceae bacterium]|nr:hypothetical protein [Rhodospirillaceae bacterium]
MRRGEDSLPRVPLRKAIQSLCRLVYSQLVQSRKLRDDVRQQIGRDVALVKAASGTLSWNTNSLGGIHDVEFLEAIRRLSGIVRLSVAAADSAALAEEKELMEDLQAIDLILRETQKAFPMPESRTTRWRNPDE